MHTEKHGTETHLDKIEARAGSPNKTNRNVLAAGLILVVLVFAIIVGFGYLQADRSGADKVNSENTAARETAQ